MTVNPLSQRIREVRGERHLTQQELAAETGLSQPTISNIERGIDTNVPHDAIRAVCRYLDLDADEAIQAVLPAMEDEGFSLACCTNADCIGGKAVASAGKLVIYPAMAWVPAELQTVYCGHCGDSLQQGCIHCRAPLSEGLAFCPICGKPYLEISASLRSADSEALVRKLDERLSRFVGIRLPVSKVKRPAPSVKAARSKKGVQPTQ